VPEAGTFGCGAGVSDGLVSSASFFCKSASCSCCDFNSAPWSAWSRAISWRSAAISVSVEEDFAAAC
jgi:hypothetical protein